MKRWALTITEIAPTEKFPDGELISHATVLSSMDQVIEQITEAHINFTCFVSVTISRVEEPVNQFGAQKENEQGRK